MKRFMTFDGRPCVAMEEVADTGGESGGGAPASTPSGDPAGSAFSQKSGTDGNPDGDPKDESGKGGGKPTSAFSRQSSGPGEKTAKDPTADELMAMSDEDWAKGVLPEDKDADGNEIDRSFMTSMAKVCREAGISPRQMRAMSDRFQALAADEMKRRDEAAAEEIRQLAEANEAATKAAIEKFDDRQWGDIRAAGKKYIPAGSELHKLMDGPLGSNIELLTILSVVGKSLRGAAPDATGAAGSGENDPALAVVLKTCGAALGK